MRIIPFVTGLLLTAGLVFALDQKWGPVPPVGPFLSPQQGFWQNAEPVDAIIDEHLVIPGLGGKVNVYMDSRLVPHVFAENDEDLYFVQGYLHAKYRLWQMEFQTIAAAGRISEILGNDPRFLRYDREQRRLGMASAAENAVEVMEKDEASRKFFEAYANGVNTYISTLSQSQLPVEYKLLDYKPEPWSLLKTALFLKAMSKDLAGYERDLEFTNQKSVFSLEDMKLLYPDVSDSSLPFISKGTMFASAANPPVKPATADSLFFGTDTTVAATEVFKPDSTNGSNNWVVGGSKTASGAPILSNDPHLNLTLPSIWYEMQLTSPTVNVYGATFPGSPNVIIGFNDQVAFGFTNAMRDVKDYYQVKFQDESKNAYLFNGEWKPTRLRVEAIKVRGAATFYDTVAYTHFGPVMYDQSFTTDSTSNTAIAVRWIAHDPSNEGAMWMKLNRAKDYDDYLAAIKDYQCPAQNMLFASKAGDIALWQQGKFPARWWGQGMYVMPGTDSSYQWQGYIPQEQNPHTLNPVEGFIQSANQRPVDSAYPYYIPGNYIVPRGITIERRLQQMQRITPMDMMRLQNDYFLSTAEDALPLLFRHTAGQSLNAGEQAYLDTLRGWDLRATPHSRAMTIYQAWFDTLENIVWNDEFSRVKGDVTRPDEQTLLEGLLRDSAFRFADNIETPQKETPGQQVVEAFRRASAALQKEESENGLVWFRHKNVSIYHLLRTSVLPFARRGLEAGGSGHTINAITTTHGPSWRMVVHLTPTTEAYGIYPGGQSGNPGSRFYDNFVDAWARGEYHTLWMMKESESKDKRIIGTIRFTNS